MTGTTQKPRSPYVHYLMDPAPREALRLAHPNAKFGELSALLGAQWKQMDESERLPYVQKSTSERQTYVAPVSGAVRKRALKKVRLLVEQLQADTETKPRVRAPDIDPSKPPPGVIFRNGKTIPVARHGRAPTAPVSKPTESPVADTERRAYHARPVICKTFPFGSIVMEGTNHPPCLSHEVRLERHQRRLRATERRLRTRAKAKAKAKAKTTPKRWRPVVCRTFQFAASLMMDGIDQPQQQSHADRHARWVRSQV